MAIRAEYDPEADALYVRVSDAPVARNIEHDHSIAVDVDDAGDIVGLVILSPRRNSAKLPLIADRLGFLDRLGEIAASIREAIPPGTYAVNLFPTISLVHISVQGAPVASGSFSIGSGVGSRDIQAQTPPVADPA
jgi:uncharacterized protein YuzE